MKLTTSRAIILRRSRHLEFDVRCTVLTSDAGKVVAVIKGAQKFNSKLKALQEIFSEVDIQIYIPSRGNYAKLISGKLLNSHQKIRNNLSSFEIASRCCEVVDALIPYHAPAPDVYETLQRTLVCLHHTVPAPMVWIMFVQRLMKCLGHGDISLDVAKLLDDHERHKLISFLVDDQRTAFDEFLSPTSTNRCLSFVDGKVAELLSWPLKTTSVGSLVDISSRGVQTSS